MDTKKNLADRSLALEAGRRLAQPDKGDEVVITGIAGFYPDSENVVDFGEKLFNKVDLISDDDRRWKLEHPEIPQRTGKLIEVNRFDAPFFGIHYKQAHMMDPMCRILLEKSYEAVVDSGCNPRTLRGARCGVFVGACFSESEKTWFYEKVQVNGFGITGCSRAMLANRISYWLGINGPSYTVDSACSSSLYALEHAYKAIRDNQCDSAIVGGCNLCLHPYVSLQFARLGVLSLDGRCKSFDESANGYCRSEAISVVYLQKQKDAKRIYATVIHAKTNCDGYKEQGITFPSGPLQQRLLEEFYEECQLSPSSLAWIEAHGTGTRVGDPEEVKALENVFCPGRTTPLRIGSVKSNIGHSEPASGLCSVTKVLIAMETGFIPPNINFKAPRKDIDAFFNGKIEVITEKTPWDGGMVGINSFGFGGANCHVLLKWNEKSKINGGAPNDDIPRIVPASGRTEVAVETLLNDVESRSVDVEYIKLFHEIHAQEIPGHIYRGFAIMNTNTSTRMRSIQFYPGDKRPLWFVFTGMGSQWVGMGKTLMKIPIFAAAIQKCHNVLKPKGVDLIKIITDTDPKIFDNVFNSFIGITAIQIGLMDVLSAVGVVPDHIIGHSMGELGCAYADGCLTAEQTILATYYRGLASLEAQLIKGAMVAIGMGYQDVKDILPPEIDVACHNSSGSCIISGPAQIVHDFMAKMQAQNIFVQELNISNIAYHSRYIAPAGPKLLSYLKQVIPNPKERSAKWVSTSVAECNWDTPQAKLCSAEYLTYNLLNSVLFEEASRHIHSNAITVEIAPHGLLQSILRRSLSKHTINIPLTQKSHADNSVVLITALGKLFEAGVNPQFAALYPEVSLPVSRGTPMIAPLVRWDHSEDWYVTSYRMQEKIKSGERTVNINLKDDDLEYLSGHVIDGRNLYPATGYLALAWETVGLMRGELYTDVSVVFEDVRFHRATNLPKDGSLDFIVMVQKGSGNFEIVEGGAAIVTGRIYVPENINKELITLDPPDDKVEIDSKHQELSSRDFYKELRLRGYNYKGLFRSIVSATNSGSIGKVQWHNNWVAFMDNLLQMQIIKQDTRGLFVPTSIQKLVIDVKKHVQTLLTLEEEIKVLPVYVYNYLDIIKCGGVQIEGLKASAIARRKPLGEPVLEKNHFYPYISNQQDTDQNNFVRMCTQLALETISTTKVKTVELLDSASNPDADVLSPALLQTLGDLPLIQADVNILSAADNPKVVDLGSNITVEDKKFMPDQSAMIVIASNVLTPSREEVFKSCAGQIKEDGFIISREKMNDEVIVPSGFAICMQRTIESEKLVVVHKPRIFKPQSVITFKIVSDNYSWVPKLQVALKNEANKKIILYAEKEPLSGIIGLVNCLRKETGGDKLSCVFIMDLDAPEFSLDLEMYQKQLSKDLPYNIFKDGVWGCYRHTTISVFEPAIVDHANINTLVRGDLSTFTWLQGPIKETDAPPKGKQLVHIYYSSLNFRDVMIMTGKLAPEIMYTERMDQDCVGGFEFSGRLPDGRRVMGMTSSMCLSNKVYADSALLWEVPDEWSLAEAATIPVVYGTAMYALITCGQMKKGDTVLIHAGTGGVGQAAIYIALHYGCTVFTTVGTPEKFEFIRRTFPQIKESHIGNSRDCSFEQLVMIETDGRGVDLVLNSLAEEKLLASVRCLAHGGRFLEIGKFDLANNNPLGMETFVNETSFHGIQLDSLFNEQTLSRKIQLRKLLSEGVKSGAVIPLFTNIFQTDQVETAFRFMAAGKHIGKVMIQIREEESDKRALAPPKKLLARRRYFCNSQYSYIIIGGLGGFGLELADWLVLRGCKKLILTSRSGLRTGYQALRTRIWKGYGVTVEVSTADVTTEEGVIDLLSHANKLGPVGAIFNLAAVLKDALFENQTEEDFAISLAPKAKATMHLDKISRKLCPQLQLFVIFSSVSCGRGNIGQTNYGMANSVMERICELRRKDGLHALAIQWGAIGEVGLVAEMQEDQLEMVIGGTLQQRISSCIEVMDAFIFTEYPVVSSMVVAEKRAGGGVAGNIVDTVVNILGLRDLKTISLHSTLAELGMDSMMAVEIKQTLEREFQVFLTPQDIRGMTFAKLQDLAAQTENEPSGAQGASTTMPEFGIDHILRVIGDELLSGEPILRLPSLHNDGSTVEEITVNDELVFLIPGVEGVASVVEPLAKNLQAQALCLQFDYENNYDSIAAIAESLLPHIKKRLNMTNKFKIVGYSFGSLVAMEIVHRLEKEGREGTLWLIDGAPDFLQTLTRKLIPEDDAEGELHLQIQIILRFIDLVWPQESIAWVENELRSLPDWDARVELLLSRAPEGLHSKRFQRLSMHAAYNRILLVHNYKPLAEKSLKCKVSLIRPSEVSMMSEEDYGLAKYCQNAVSIHFVDGNHLTILDSKKSAELINKPTFEKDSAGFKQPLFTDTTKTILPMVDSVKQK